MNGKDLFSTATSGVGWTAVVIVLLYMGYSAWRITCCCAGRKAKKAAERGAAEGDPARAGRGACDVPLHIHPVLVRAALCMRCAA